MADPWKESEEERRRKRKARQRAKVVWAKNIRKDKDVKKKAKYTAVGGAKPPKKGTIGRKLQKVNKTTPAKAKISTSEKAVKARANKRRNPDNLSKDVKKKAKYTTVGGSKPPKNRIMKNRSINV